MINLAPKSASGDSNNSAITKNHSTRYNPYSPSDRRSTSRSSRGSSRGSSPLRRGRSATRSASRSPSRFRSRSRADSERSDGTRNGSTASTKATGSTTPAVAVGRTLSDNQNRLNALAAHLEDHHISRHGIYETDCPCARIRLLLRSAYELDISVITLAGTANKDHPELYTGILVDYLGSVDRCGGDCQATTDAENQCGPVLGHTDIDYLGRADPKLRRPWRAREPGIPESLHYLLPDRASQQVSFAPRIITVYEREVLPNGRVTTRPYFYTNRDNKQ